MSESIAQTQTRLSAFIQGAYPNADVSPGSALSELVVKLAATLQNQIYNQITTFAAASAISQVQSSTTPTYNTTIDAIASNFNATRNAGTYASGVLKITLTTNSNVTISTNAVFIQSTLGLNYSPTQSYTFSANNTATNNYLPIYTQSTGIYYILLPVQAAATGAQYQVTDQSQFTLSTTSTNPYTNSAIIAITAYGNFTGGTNQQSDQQLISTFKTTLANSTFASTAGINNYLTTNFTGFSNLSVVGANDVEMTRSTHNAFGISTFGMADLYVKTSAGTSLITITLLATKTATGTWQTTISNTVCPGFYTIKGILPVPINNQIIAGNLVINSVTYGYSAINATRNNQIFQLSDARFTAYQNAVVSFQYTEVPAVAIGSTMNFNFTFYYQPNILPIQQVFLNDPTRIVNADYLVKAALPCFVSVVINLLKKNSTDTAASIGIPNLQQDIYNFIDGLGFSGVLNASDIINLCYKYPIGSVSLPIQLTGTIYTINGTTEILTSNNQLVIPTETTGTGVSPNTTVFLIDYLASTTGSTVPSQNIQINLN